MRVRVSAHVRSQGGGSAGRKTALENWRLKQGGNQRGSTCCAVPRKYRSPCGRKEHRRAPVAISEEQRINWDPNIDSVMPGHPPCLHSRERDKFSFGGKVNVISRNLQSLVLSLL